MSNVPEAIDRIQSVAEMLHVFSTLAHGRTAARFVLLHLSDPTLNQLRLGMPEWPRFEVRSRDPFLALFVHGGESHNGPPTRGQCDSPTALLTIVEGCAVMGSLARRDLFDEMVYSLVIGNYPDLGRTSLETDFILGMLQSVAEAPECESFEIVGFTGRTQLGKPVEQPKVWETIRKWTHLPLEALLRDVRATQARAISTGFELEWRHPTLDSPRPVMVRASIHREGVFTARGDVVVVWNRLVRLAARQISQRQRLYSGRDRGRVFERPAQPLAISYGSPVFADKAHNAMLLRVLRDMTHASLSVYHGNPYLHATLVDRLDGSSFSIWVLSAERIIVMPGARATSTALDRLVSHIMTKFREGQVADLHQAG